MVDLCYPVNVNRGGEHGREEDEQDGIPTGERLAAPSSPGALPDGGSSEPGGRGYPGRALRPNGTGQIGRDPGADPDRSVASG